MFARACEDKSIRYEPHITINLFQIIMKLVFIHQASSVLTANWSTLSMRISGEKKEIKSALIQLLLWVDTIILYVHVRSSM